LGYVIIGGMVVSTLITLYLVPAVFVVLERIRSQRAALAAASTGRRPAVAAATGPLEAV
jgi:hypothetical protein